MEPFERTMGEGVSVVLAGAVVLSIGVVIITIGVAIVCVGVVRVSAGVLVAEREEDDSELIISDSPVES